MSEIAAGHQVALFPSWFLSLQRCVRGMTIVEGSSTRHAQ
eukprot:CAMPEP_0176202146 /NCGR_PEP_ID=MMETSP0121_2-20121125/9926_1 /TAXON_ID=160619 /ORGANISM="Kryptoperidinium foliaceum, Strain CCMP 1326" /LENGTH=39 /DNA_ID= /DNA_START= /DNA_END= /DNA_ORIENTATION=